MTRPNDSWEVAESRTPLSVSNRSGLDSLRYRVGTHSSFLRSMKAELSRRGFPLLGRLTSDTGDDPAVALLDAWATVADVLTFYQERIANEGYLQTATEHRSLVELARLVGYVPRSGLAASVHLAYTVESIAGSFSLPDQGRITSAMTEPPVIIPAGARIQTIPGPGELPQTFETAEDLEARARWNKLKPALTRPQRITPEGIENLATLYVDGTSTGLKSNDLLLFVFQNSPKPFYRRIDIVHDPDFANKRTLVTLQSLPTSEKVEKAGDSAVQSLVLPQDPHPTQAETLKREILKSLKQEMAATTSSKERAARLSKRVASLERIATESGAGETRDWLMNLVTTLNKMTTNHLDGGRKKAEGPSQALSLERQRADGPVSELVYAALAGSVLPKDGGLSDHLSRTSLIETSVVTVYAFRVKASLFGHNAPQEPKGMDNNTKVMTFDEWDSEDIKPDDKTPNTLYLDASYDKITPDSWVILEYSPQGIMVPRSVRTVDTGISRAAYGVTCKTTRLVLSSTSGEAQSWLQDKEGFKGIRQTVVYAQSEELSLAAEPYVASIGGESSTQIELDGYVEGLKPGRWLIVTGEEEDITKTPKELGLEGEIPGGIRVQGARRSELVQLAEVHHGWPTLPSPNKKETPPRAESAAPAVPIQTTGKTKLPEPAPGNTAHTTLVFQKGLQARYKRETVEIYGNVVRATHGETRNEILGSGDAGKALQRFTLSQKPLTYTAASTPTGSVSTLSVYVNGIRWKEAARLTDLRASDRGFVVQTDEEQKTNIIFGDGQNGARLPTGIENVKAEYRSGLGKVGNVDAERIRLLMTRPLGVKAVDNPLRASGGADQEGSVLIRANASLGVMAFDRVVSAQDYEDFARNFSGIGKARAELLRHGRQQFIHLTIAGIDDGPIDKDSDLYTHLHEALRRYGDPHHQFSIDSRELLALILSAKVAVNQDHRWADVEQQVRTALLSQFSFAKRALGQDAFLSEVISTIQNVPGAEYVDVDEFSYVSQIQGTGEQARLLTFADLDRLAKEALKKPDCPLETAITVNPARTVNGAVRPAQLAYIPFAVPNAIVVNPGGRHG